jgi:hypothetical protein
MAQTPWSPVSSMSSVSSMNVNDVHDVEKGNNNTIQSVLERSTSPRPINGRRLSYVGSIEEKRMSTLALDAQKYLSRNSSGASDPRPISRIESPSRMSRRISPPNSAVETIEEHPGQIPQRRSSDSSAQTLARAEFRKSNNVTPDSPRRPMSTVDFRKSHNRTPESPRRPMSTTRLPPFAPKPREDILHVPPPVGEVPAHKKRPRSSRSQSIDVVHAAKVLGNPAWSTTMLIRDKSQLPASSFAYRVYEAGKPGLMYEQHTREMFKPKRTPVLDLTALQQMTKHVLQQKLVEQVKAIGEKGAWMEIGIRETLHEYCKS